MVEDIRIYNFCPCYKDFEGELICLNDDNLIDIDRGMIGLEILGRDTTLDGIKRFEVGDGSTCFTSIYTHEDCVYCVSQGWKIRIHNEDITEDMLNQSIKLYTLGDIEPTIDCASCVYGILLALVLVQDQASIKRYLDEFSLKVAIKLAEIEQVPTEVNGDYFKTVQTFLVSLLDDQYYCQDIHDKYSSSSTDEQMSTIAKMMTQLDRNQFQFYSQVLNIKGVNNSRLLMKMLSHILRISKGIYDLNNEIHSMIVSRTWAEYSEDEGLTDKIEHYLQKSRTLDHFFGNILDIVKSAR